MQIIFARDLEAQSMEIILNSAAYAMQSRSPLAKYRRREGNCIMGSPKSGIPKANAERSVSRYISAAANAHSKKWEK